ncbi:solute carrier family 22 member 21-like [Pomacea canaliculata]|uniref:solute carrier family 22 member 21-like n=1 Tax=Pomacea canaliculata TaxID=400727 RepID=UPI000D72B62A|nr:solute carrier family 22 member 21-like [Pomacea canaliculata]
MTKVSLLSGLVWVFCSMTYYGISFGIKNLSGDFYLNLLLMAVLEMPPNLVMVSLLNWLGRRWTSAGSFLLAAAAVLIVIPVSITVSAPEAGVAVSTLSMVAKTSIIFGWSAVTVHHIELFPTVVRNIGMGYLNTVARIGGILAPYILFQGNGSGFGFYVIIAVAMVLNAAACLLLRETGDESLQEYIEETNAMEVRPGDVGIVETNSNVKVLTGPEVGENQD